MKSKKQIGVWMDHSVAHLTEQKDNNSMTTHNIKSKFTHYEKEHSVRQSESLMHNKEHHLQAEYYKQIAGALAGHEEILLFGPTKAKEELSHLLKANHQFAGASIVLKHADKMNEQQQQAFVKEHFDLL